MKGSVAFDVMQLSPDDVNLRYFKHCLKYMVSVNYNDYVLLLFKPLIHE